MSTTCNTGSNIPTLSVENCNGEYTSTECIVNEAALPYLNLPVNSFLSTILNTLVLANQHKDELITGLDERIAALEETVLDLDARLTELEP